MTPNTANAVLVPCPGYCRDTAKKQKQGWRVCVITQHRKPTADKRKRNRSWAAGMGVWLSREMPWHNSFWKIILQRQGCHQSLGYLKDAPIVLDKREDAAWWYSRSLHLAWGCDQVVGSSLFCLLRWGVSFWLTNRGHMGSFHSNTHSRMSIHSYGVKAQTLSTP